MWKGSFHVNFVVFSQVTLSDSQKHPWWQNRIVQNLNTRHFWSCLIENRAPQIRESHPTPTAILGNPHTVTKYRHEAKKQHNPGPQNMHSEAVLLQPVSSHR